MPPFVVAFKSARAVSSGQEMALEEYSTQTKISDAHTFFLVPMYNNGAYFERGLRMHASRISHG